MITRKNTLEITNSKRSGEGDTFPTDEFPEDVLGREETIGLLDDLEFGSMVAEPSPQGSKRSEKPLVQEKPSDPKVKPKPWKSLYDLPWQKLHDLPRKYFLLLALVVVFLVIGSYLLSLQTYTVGTRLVFIVGDRNALEKEGWSPVRELSILQNPGTLSLLSRRYYNSIDPIRLFNKNDKNAFDSMAFVSTVVSPATVQKDHFKKASKFESWLSQSIAFEPDFNSGQNQVVLKLTGYDPSFLKGVLQDYVGSYVDLRRAIDSRSKEKVEKPVQSGVESSAREKLAQNVDEKIKKLDALQNEYQLGLTLMDSGGGSFSALSLDTKSPIYAALTKFQDKIIQLEIERGLLESRFTPQSREIKSVDFQIQGVKGLMMQYLTEQIEYLKKDRELLVAQKNDLEGKTPDAQMNEDPKDLGSPSGMLVNGAKWHILNNGLSVITETPFVASKPFLAKLGDAKEAFVSSLFASPANRPGPSPYFDQRGPYPPSAKQDYETLASPQGGPANVYGPGQSMEFYRNDMNSFARR